MGRIILKRQRTRTIYSCSTISQEMQLEKARQIYIDKLIKRRKLVELCLADLSILSESMYRRYLK